MITWRQKSPNIWGSLKTTGDVWWTEIRDVIIWVFYFAEQKLISKMFFYFVLWRWIRPVETSSTRKLFWWFFSRLNGRFVALTSCGKVSHVGWLNMSCHVSLPSLTKQEMLESGEILTWCGSAKVTFFFFFQSAVFVLPPSAAVTFDPSSTHTQTHTHRAFSVWIFRPHLFVKTQIPQARSFQSPVQVFLSFSDLSDRALPRFLWPEYSPYLQRVLSTCSTRL